MSDPACPPTYPRFSQSPLTARRTCMSDLLEEPAPHSGGASPSSSSKSSELEIAARAFPLDKATTTEITDLVC
jgi:hypothetical protein